MPLDGLHIAALVDSLTARVEGSLIQRIQQPDHSTVLLTLHRHGVTTRLIASCDPQFPRIHTTAASHDMPVEPPQFCLVLRKHLLGGRIVSVSQADDFERVVWITVERGGDLQQGIKRLVCEIMGRHSNIVLLDEQGMVLDAARRVTPEMSTYRTLVPGCRYVPPPPQEKVNPLLCEPRSLPRSGALKEVLVRNFAGIGPSTASMLLKMLSIDEKSDLAQMSQEAREDLCHALSRACRTVISAHSPTLLKDAEGRPSEFFAVSVFPGQLYPSMDDLVDAFFTERRHYQVTETLRAALKRLVHEAMEKASRRLVAQQSDLARANEAPRLKSYGDAILSSMHTIQKGQTRLYWNDFQTGETIEVPLDPALGPTENAQRYFKKYKKARAAKDELARQIEKTRLELAYLEQVDLCLDASENEAELLDIGQELVEQGYAKPPRKARRRKQMGARPARYLRFTSSDGLPILVGRSNWENDMLFKKARPGEIWLHAKDIPGAHVYVKHTGEVPDRTLEEAASLAAYFSRARNSSKVAVDYTRTQHLSKPPGSRPGMLVYRQQRTIMVSPALLPQS
ncbi:MAG: NFACT RNA binding domain-containing protein [Bacillota bacterium]